ncbi:flavin reductase family protein [Herbiconiux sp. KACC 21604]|uniref:flavin reductase family protein n=1 Tax=unclassified Herbiconiux TaxID=2618217 RepID=UPI001491B743|nr:flavin reductase family protein [Herbiconiux sp. SALV-R1]QJU55662.1 flavin reductase family protein [Herbiconiux sp. SALV-R1]WPO86862.1 flavin reductase family protein [Herbiconiux sp. KACC 21604]
MPIDPQIFRTIMGHYPTGVCVVTAITPEGKAVGMTVGTFTSVSLDPPLIGFFPDRRSTSWPSIAAAGRFCVNVLADDQEHLGKQFASRVDDKFVDVAHRRSDSGLPLLDGAVAWIECSLYSVGDAGDHLLVLGEVEAMSAEGTVSPLVFHQGAFRQVALRVPAVA